MKCLLKSLGQIHCAKVPQSFSCNQVFFNTLTWGQLCPSLYTFLSSQRHFPYPSQKSFEQRKPMTFDLSPASMTAPFVRGLYCPFSQSLV